MSCFSCAATFSMFRKELGCKNCGFAFCKECLCKKARIPKLNNEIHKVCGKCYNILTGKREDVPERISPPKAHLDRMAALDKSGSGQGKHRSSPASLPAGNQAKYTNMRPEDVAMAQRLEALQADRKKNQPTVPSQKEMEERLNNLKGPKVTPPSHTEMSERLARLQGKDPAATKAPITFKSDNRTEQEQADDLLDQFCAEVELDARLNPIRDVENRLAQLRGEGAARENSPNDLSLNLDSASGSDKNYVKNVADEAGGAPDERVNWTEVQRLLEEVSQEVQIDAQKALVNLQKDKEITDRLAKMKGTRQISDEDNEGNGEDSSLLDSDKDEDDEEMARDLIQQLCAEVKLDEAAGRIGGAHSSETPPVEQSHTASEQTDTTEDEDELPWCCICNNDASVRCRGCDGDLYCSSCFKEGHDRFEMNDHDHVTYRPPQNSR